MRRFGLIWAGVATMVAPPALAQVFDNAAVITLHKAGLGTSSIQAKVESMPCAYDVSTQALVALKKAGLGEGVIAAMVRRCANAVRPRDGGGGGASMGDPANPLAAHPPGIYLFPQSANPTPMPVLRPSQASGVKISGNGSLLFPHIARLVVPRASAQLRVANALPTFYFYFEPSDRKVGGFGTVSSGAAQSPEEFNLVRFIAKNGERQAVIGKNEPLNYQRGVDPRFSIPFAIADMGEGIFRVTMDAPLEPGEYAFILAAESRRMNYFRIYDFAITGPAA